MEKQEGILVFDEFDGKFAIAKDEHSFPFTTLEYGDSFEVKYMDKWIKTCLEITNNDKGELVFKLKGIDFDGDITGFDARK